MEGLENSSWPRVGVGAVLGRECAFHTEGAVCANSMEMEGGLLYLWNSSVLDLCRVKF